MAQQSAVSQLQDRFPDVEEEMIRDALRDCDGHAGRAAATLRRSRVLDGASSDGGSTPASSVVDIAEKRGVFFPKFVYSDSELLKTGVFSSKDSMQIEDMKRRASLTKQSQSVGMESEVDAEIPPHLFIKARGAWTGRLSMEPKTSAPDLAVLVMQKRFPDASYEVVNVALCASGGHNGRAATKLRRAGFQDCSLSDSEAAFEALELRTVHECTIEEYRGNQIEPIVTVINRERKASQDAAMFMGATPRVAAKIARASVKDIDAQRIKPRNGARPDADGSWFGCCTARERGPGDA